MARRSIPLSVRKEAARLRASNVPDEQIAKQLGISTSAIRHWYGPRRVVTESRKIEAMRLREEDRLTNTEIAEELDVAVNTVYQWIGAPPASYRKRNPRAHPEWKYHEAVRLRREEDLSNPLIAERLGLNANTVWAWLGATPRELMAKPRRDYSHLRYHHRAMYLRECGLSVTEIAQEMQVPRSTVGGWVKGVGCYGVSLD